MTPPNARARFADQALAAYLAPLVLGRRVAVVGPTSGDLTRRARALGAQTVVSFGGQGEDIAVRALIPGAIANFPGKLDVIVVPSAGGVPSLVAVLDEARRVLGSEGVVVVASEPEDGPQALEDGARRAVGFHDLRDLCAARFARVQMLGRGAFLGYLVASLDVAEAPGISLETRLMEGDLPRPEAFIAVASDSQVSLDAMTVVQVPGEVVQEVRDGASRALKEELATQGQKLKDVEAASAERWVKIQRYEHHLKELEEESRKTRDRAVRLSKDLEDERKLRQRIELDAQMSRRAPELPRGSDEELKKAREALAALEGELKTQHDKLGAAERERTQAVAALEASRTRISDLERELDETQAVESDLRAQLDEALEKGDATALEAELAKRERALAELHRAHAEAVAHGERDHSRMEQELRDRSAEVVRLKGERAGMLQSVRELSFTVEQLTQRELAVEAAALRATMEEMRSVSGALADRAEELVRENDLLRERLAAAEARQEAPRESVIVAAAPVAPAREEESGVLEALRAEIDLLTTARAELRSDRDALQQRVDAFEDAEAAHEGAIAGARLRVRELEATIEELRRTLIEERGSREVESRTADEARAEASRLYAVNAGLEARTLHLEHELAGARAGFALRSAELEAQYEDRLAECAAESSQRLASQADEAMQHQREHTEAWAGRLSHAEAALARAAADVEALRAERTGMSFRLAEAERAVREVTADGARDAAALRSALSHAKAEAMGKEFRLREAELALTEIRVHPGKVAAAPSAEEGPSLSLELLDQDDAGARGRLEQVLADLSATAERLAQTEELLAAARAESASHAHDVSLLVQKLDARELEFRDAQTRLEQQLAEVQRSATGDGEGAAAMRQAIESARNGISAILIDGRGAVVAHDLVLILRRLEEFGG